ncbi:hypothetical protein JOC34_002853 [Virgibacillus halotolerans]|uniref:hypothetical protein n=1 Tax=Virgibacillus halotolerans TaxID=1071053 RepID=UPI00195F5865|nr:hypothetical protein [Virgibacillus halotolerans]MBM7600462.1 hypothetical protein [Virgibacillus halotolerans]
MSAVFSEQIRRVLEDQRQELRDIRQKRRELLARMSELDDEEITAIVGIRKTRAILEEMQADEY